jgi:HD superfamily phosphodiesterase
MNHFEHILEQGRIYLTSGWSISKTNIRTSRVTPELVFDHSLRVLEMAKRLAKDPQIQEKGVDELVLSTSALFHDAAWVDWVKMGQIQPTEIFSRPTDTEFCKRSAQIACDQVGKTLPARTLEKVVQAITEMKIPRPSLTDAVLLADADGLEDFGLLGFTLQVRMAQATGKSALQILETWHRQQEYHYWEARIKNAFHLRLSKTIANQRLETMGQVFELLRREIHLEDMEAGGVPLRAKVQEASNSEPG